MGIGSVILPALIWNWALAWLAKTYKPGWIGGILGYLISFSVPIGAAFAMRASQPEAANFVALFGPVSLVFFPLNYWWVSRRS